MKCLSIESVEYCYFIPILSQLAEYWGDEKTAYLCKIMSRQVKQHLNHATHIHLLLSGQLKDHLVLDDKFQTFFKSIKLDKEKQKCDEFQLSHKNIYVSHKSKFYFPDQNLTFTSCPKVIYNEVRSNNKIKNEENRIILKLKQIDNSFFQLLASGSPEVRSNANMKCKKQQINVNSIYELFRRNKIVDKEIFFLFLQILRYRKICKAEQWYPFVSTLAFNHRLFQLSRSFIQLSESEKQMSQLVTILINK
jgi:hypothetical protein